MRKRGKRQWYCSTAIKQGRKFCDKSKPIPEDVIKNMLKESHILTEFDREVFDILVEKVVVGGIDENGEIDPYMINFILKSNKSSNNYIEENENKKE